VYGLLARRNAVLLLMSVELMLNAVNLDLVAFDVWLRDALHNGQTLTLFVITVAAAEVGLGLAIVLQVFRQRGTVAIDELVELAEPDTRPEPAAEPETPLAADPNVADPKDLAAVGADPADGAPT
jgi:NADH-quinone oxidoreductase subunit K